MTDTMLKSDLHVHLKYSTRPSEWVPRKIGCSESYSDPQRIYRVAGEGAMHLVTIMDANTLTGSLKIAHLENAFMPKWATHGSSQSFVLDRP